MIEIFYKFLVYTIKNCVKKLYWHIKKGGKYLLSYPWFLKDLYRFGKNLKSVENIDFYPILDDRLATTSFDRHYIYQGVWAADRILKSGVAAHTDIGSQVDFVGFLSIQINVEFIDIRPLQANFKKFKSTKGSILEIPHKDNSVQSLSCLHVVEHIGLGRYGDSVDPGGAIKACKEMQRVLARGGILYLSAPVGKSKIFFNAHRIFKTKTILEYFDQCGLVEISAVYDNGDFKENVDIKSLDDQNYACGMFIFKKH